jgi:hypothetical protein
MDRLRCEACDEPKIDVDHQKDMENKKGKDMVSNNIIAILQQVGPLFKKLWPMESGDFLKCYPWLSQSKFNTIQMQILETMFLSDALSDIEKDNLEKVVMKTLARQYIRYCIPTNENTDLLHAMSIFLTPSLADTVMSSRIKKAILRDLQGKNYNTPDSVIPQETKMKIHQMLREMTEQAK